MLLASVFSFFFNDTAPTEISPLPLHDALPILDTAPLDPVALDPVALDPVPVDTPPADAAPDEERVTASVTDLDAMTDRKSTRLNSSHSQISYAVFCLKKKKRKGITGIVICSSH